MAERFLSRRNIDFVLYELFNVEQLTGYDYFKDHSRDTFNMIIDTAHRIGTDLMYPAFQEMDEKHPEYFDGVVKTHPAVKAFLKEFGESGWINAGMAYAYNGQQLPKTILNVTSFMFNAANYSLSVYPNLTRGAANLIVSFGSQEQKDTYLDKMFAGKWQGTMALTEPDAGSSLADIRSSAEPTADGTYLIKGKKIFISAADTDAVENTVHMLLAKIKSAPDGVRGISMFIVPKYRLDASGSLVFNHVTCDGIEQKLGYKGSPICQLSLGEDGDCYGYLVGEANKGLAYMFQMMNEKRVAVGIGAAGKATAAYYAALEYSRQRLQGRKASNKDPLSPQIPIIEHADVKRMLLFQRAICEGAFSLAVQASMYLDLSFVEVEKEKYDLISDLLIPIVKSYPSEMGILSTSAAIQCMGGYGYCNDFPVAQYYRDVRIDPIHEGTTGIHGKDLLGRKVTMKDGKAYRLVLEEIDQAIKYAAETSSLKPYAEQLNEYLNLFKEITDYLLSLNYRLLKQAG